MFLKIPAYLTKKMGPKKEEEAHGQREEEARRKDARMEKSHSQEEGVAENRLRTEKSETYTET